MNNKEIAIITKAIVETLEEMKNGTGGSDGIYDAIRSKGKTFDSGFQFAIDLIKGAME